jgi:hypothetical protein
MYRSDNQSPAGKYSNDLAGRQQVKVQLFSVIANTTYVVFLRLPGESLLQALPGSRAAKRNQLFRWNLYIRRWYNVHKIRIHYTP